MLHRIIMERGKGSFRGQRKQPVNADCHAAAAFALLSAMAAEGKRETARDVFTRKDCHWQSAGSVQWRVQAMRQWCPLTRGLLDYSLKEQRGAAPFPCHDTSVAHAVSRSTPAV